jgi:hypothetical protein
MKIVDSLRDEFAVCSEGIQHDIPHDAVDQGDRANPEPQGQDRDAGETRCSAQCPDAIDT